MANCASSRHPIVPSCLCVWGGRHCLSPLHHLPPSPLPSSQCQRSGALHTTASSSHFSKDKRNQKDPVPDTLWCGAREGKAVHYTQGCRHRVGGDHPANIGIPGNTARTEATWPLLSMLAVNNQTDLSHLQLSAPGNRQSRDSLNTTRISVLPLSGTASNLLVLWVRQVVQHLPFNPFIYYWKSLPPPPSLVFGK